MKIAICDDEQNIRESIRELIEQIDEQNIRKTNGEVFEQNRRKANNKVSPEQNSRETYKDIPEQSHRSRTGEFPKKAAGNAENEIYLFSNGPELLAADVLSFDIIFLDIEMGEHGGLDAAKEIRMRQKNSAGDIWGSFPLIIFVTGYREHMPEAFVVHAFGYVVKPIGRESFEKLYSEAAAECRKRENGREDIIIKNGEKCQKIPMNEIVYIESSGRKNVIHTMQEEISYYGALRALETELPPCFYRVHKGYIVNMKMIRQYSRSQMKLTDGSTVLISKYRYAAFVAAYMEFLR